MPLFGDARGGRRRYRATVIGTARIASIVLLLVLVGLIPVALAEGRPVPNAPSCPMTPADSFWHADVSGLPVLPQSGAWISSMGSSAGLKADFGSGLWDGGPIGIPYTTVPGNQPKVPVSFDYDDESDPGPYPIPPDAPIEGGPSSTGDRHVLVVDRDACRLWEVFSAYPQGNGSSWTAGSGATWSLNSNVMRPLGWTSGDAAGLPILPGLVRYDEVAAGEIDHVIRFTAPKTANAYVWPASHKAGSGGSSDPPMGAWFRLKASYDISHFSAQNQVILRALKKHGMVLADNGSPFYMSGAPDSAWNNSDLNALKAIPGSAFEAVDVASLKLSNTSYAVASAAPPPAAPVNTAWPVLSGTARDGQTLSTTNGTWTGTAPITYSYAWRRCDTSGANCTTIANASGQSYVLTAADVGSKVYSLVTASNAGGSASQRSALSAVVSAAKPVNTAWPVLSGTARDGQTLSTTNGTWTGTAPITYSYAWRRCDTSGANCTTIANASGQSYVLTAADVGSKVYSLVTASNAGGSASQRSALSAVVSAAKPVNTAWPVLSGTARDGQTLSTTNGTWTGTAPITYSYAWRRCDTSGANCTTIANASGQSYVLTAADVGSKVYSLVTASNAGGSASQRSALSAVVVAP